MIFFSIGAVLGQTHHGHGHEHNVVSPSHVTSTNEKTTQNPDDILCPYFLSLDCDAQISDPNYRVCGSDGITYVNNCRFLQKSCQFDSLEVVHQGACNSSSTTPVTDMTSTIPLSTTMKALTAGVSTVTPSHGPIGSSTQSALPGETTVAITTIPSIAQIVQSVFCDNKDSIKCDYPPNLKCGSNGVTYPNECEFYKAVCDDSSLVPADPSRCGTHSRRSR
ncbi:ovomucoid-like [Mizuhopecten yessoensis]|nr:ovomucoid-like [Mizuhopecten yessoensis]